MAPVQEQEVLPLISLSAELESSAIPTAEKASSIPVYPDLLNHNSFPFFRPVSVRRECGNGCAYTQHCGFTVAVLVALAGDSSNYTSSTGPAQPSDLRWLSKLE
ncbi:hypothetical protein PCANC_02623 [Puccinia coronata f. sp. avenae]|uniref:Uncharacterized protein n=1 Tax=Puccinia coronata f. sp. avenae TaxID=200324 RepID=A0A2N5W5N9_9BASI|nr:hypothetical protein PCANC_02623 [Puccinia coronata f. sp. avenae]